VIRGVGIKFWNMNPKIKLDFDCGNVAKENPNMYVCRYLFLPWHIFGCQFLNCTRCCWIQVIVSWYALNALNAH
jgi:hypothetical protein